MFLIIINIKNTIHEENEKSLCRFCFVILTNLLMEKTLIHIHNETTQNYFVKVNSA